MVEKRKLNNGKYTVERLLGSGRFSQTLLAYHTEGNRQDERLVIKTLRMFDENSTRKSSEEIKKLNDKLHREATKLSRCDHPHVVQLIDEEFTETDSFGNELVCLPLEYICGLSLEDLAVTQQVPTLSNARKMRNEPLIEPIQYASISSQVNDVILWAMELEPEKRPQSMEEWLKSFSGEEEEDLRSDKGVDYRRLHNCCSSSGRKRIWKQLTECWKSRDGKKRVGCV